MLKKGNNIFSLLVILLSIFMTSSTNIVNADMAGEENSSVTTEQTGNDQSNTTTDWSDKGFISNPQLLDKDGNKLSNSNINDTISVNWSLDIPKGTNIKDGDTLEAPIPDDIITGNVSGFLIDRNSQQEIGTLTTKSGDSKIYVQFNNNAETLNTTADLTGNISAQVKWNTGKVNPGDSITISWPTTGAASGTPTDTTVNIDPTTGPSDDETVYKWGSIDGDDIQWDVRVNYKGNFSDNPNQVNNAVYEDQIGPNQEFVPGSVKVMSVIYDKDSYNYNKRADVTPLSVNETDSTHFSVNLGDISGTYIIEYHTKIIGDQISSKYFNSGDLKGNDTTVGSVQDSFAEVLKIGGTVVSNRTISGTKTWKNDNESQRPDSIVVNLQANLGPNGTYKTEQSQTVTAADGWTYSFNNLLNMNSNGVIKYRVRENPVAGYTATYSSDDNNFDIVNTPTASNENKTKFTVNKKWDNAADNNKPTSVQVQLYDNNGNAIGDPVTLKASSNADKNWTYTWSDLDDSKTYSVKEINLPSTYTSSQSQTGNTVTITNTYKNSVTPPTTDKRDFTVYKNWSGDTPSDRPASVKIQLLADGNAQSSPITINKPAKDSDPWSYTWKDLAKNNADGKAIHYSAKEVDPSSKYTASNAVDDKDDTSTTITNTFNNGGSTNPPTPDTKTINVKKIWSDGGNKDNIRPNDVTVHLLKNGNIIQSVTLNSLNGWSYDFTGLDKNANYTVEEVPVDGYITTQSTENDIVTITNTHTPTKTPGNPGNPGTTTPGNPGTTTPGNPDNPGNPGTTTPGNPNTPTGTTNTPSTSTPGGDTSSFTPNNPMVPSVPYSNKTPNTGLLPQTGSATNIIYMIAGFVILGLVGIYLIRRRIA